MWLWIILGVASLVWWVVADFRWFLRWSAEASELAARGEWERLVAHHEAGLGSRRVFVLLMRWLLMPGAMEIQFALHLHMMGWNSRAVTLIDKVMGTVRKQPKLLAPALATRSLVLGALGRMHEAEACHAELASLPDVQPELMASGVQVALWAGHWQHALDRAARVMEQEPNEESARLGSAVALSELGRFEEAVRMTEYRPRTVAEMQRDPALRELAEDSVGRQMLDAQERERAEISKPSPFLQAAEVYLESGDPDAALVYLARAEPVLGNHPLITANYRCTSAMALAMQSSHVQAQQHLQRARETVEILPHHHGIRFEFLVAQARCMLSSGDANTAVKVLDHAHAEARFPAAQHVLHYWRARALEADNRVEEAVPEYRALVADGFEGWRTDRAREALKRLGVDEGTNPERKEEAPA